MNSSKKFHKYQLPNKGANTMNNASEGIIVPRSTRIITYAQPGIFYRQWENTLEERMQILLRGKSESETPIWNFQCSVALSPEDAINQIKQHGDLAIFHYPNICAWPTARVVGEARRMAELLSRHENRPWVSLEKNSEYCANLFESFHLTVATDPLESFVFQRWLSERKIMETVA